MDSTNQATLSVVKGAFVDISDKRRLALLHARALALGEDFTDWLQLNWHIWDDFQKLSDQMRTKGRKYYAARTVIEVMRWHSHLTDRADADYKLNNNHTPKMARLYNAICGEEFFRTREHGG